MSLKRPYAASVALAAAAAVLALAAGAAAQTATAPAGPAPPPAPSGEPAGADLNVSERGTVELHVQGADLRRVLQLLSTQSKTNIIASKDVQGSVTADLYGVTFSEALEAVLSSAGYTYLRKGNFIYVMTAQEYAEQVAAGRKLSTKVFRLSYLTAADAKALITPAMSKDGVISTTPAAAVGVGTSSDDAGGNALAAEDVLIVQDYDANLEQITAILCELDIRPLQVLIEATILRATLDERNALGVDFNALAGVDFRGMQAQSNGTSSITTGNVPTANIEKGVAAGATNFNAGIDTGGLSIGVIYNEIAFFIRALESVTDVAVLANPKLLVLNKQRGEVLVGNRDGYITTTFTETTASQSVEFLETGTRLVVRPYVGADGYVRMEIHPEDSTGGINADRLPFQQTTEATSNVIVRDGHTIVIGGLFRERTNNGRAQVPLLGNLPGVGTLFRRRTEQTTREEVIILITPHIIRHPADEVASAQIADDVTRMRLGLRQGLMWFGRERLAQTHMRWAREHIARGNCKMALWDINLALSLEPRMIEALHLKERLTKQAIWAGEARYSSAAYIVQQMILNELSEPVEKVAIPHKPLDVDVLPESIREALGLGQRHQLPLEKAARPGCDEVDDDVQPYPPSPNTPPPASGQ